ncbi:MAG TPA: hypothetical protein VGS07_02855 [Thermoanaerobaculia bacterium]|jgi:hypothetical protein|nr:hypothetical protein [Thermoanaerobaculia bacterium]
MHWASGEITILLPEGGELVARGLIHEAVAVIEHEDNWLVLHRRTGMILGSFTTKGLALDLGDRLSRSLSRSLKRMPKSWAGGLRGRLEELRAEHARDNGLPPPPPLPPL